MSIPSYAVRFRGMWACPCLAEWIPVYEALMLKRGRIRFNLDLYQLIGDAAASAGYHRGGGCADIAQAETEDVRIARNMGAAASRRDSRDGMMIHDHLVLKGCPHAVTAAKAQIVEIERGGDGLVGSKPDRGPRTGVEWPLRTYREGIAWAKDQLGPKFTIKVASYVAVKNGVYGRKTYGIKGVPHTSGPHPAGFTFTSQGYVVTPEGLFIQAKNGEWFAGSSLDLVPPVKRVETRIRVGTFNLPDEAKLAHAADRVKLAARQIIESDLDVIGLQELVGRTGTGKPSEHAAALMDALGDGFTLIFPTTALNENYIVLRDATTTLVKQYRDAIIRVVDINGKAVPGRHVTRVVLRDKRTRGMFVFGNTHLVNDNELGAQAQAVYVGTTLKAVSTKHHDAPIVLVGDTNLPGPIGGLGAAGLVDTREGAHTSTAGYDTYVNKSKTAPTKSGRWMIDRIYATRGTIVRGWNVVLAGSFGKLRPSDHILCIAAVVLHAPTS